MNRTLCCPLLLALVVLVGAASASPARAQSPLQVCATTPDLAALCRAIGGDAVDVDSFATGPEDPHFLEARPSMIRRLNRTELLLLVGRDLEAGWLPLLQQNARNAAVLAGAAGCFVAADHVRALGVPEHGVDRSAGDVHAGGNPHFFADPLCGLQVGAALAARLSALRPERAAAFAAGLQQLRTAIADALVGPQVAARYDHDAEKLLKLLPGGRLADVLRAQGDLDAAGGWFALLRARRGAAVVADHDLWPYFAERFDLRVVAFLEPKPGVPPTTTHLQQVVELMQREHVVVILSAPYFAAEHAEFVARATGARIAAMAHQVGSRPAATDYVALVDSNVRAVAAALAEAAK